MILSRYVTKEVLQAVLAITLVLVAALLCQQIIRYLNFVAIGKVPVSVFFKLIAYEIPYLLAFLLPLGLYLGILIAFGRLYADHEMAIIRLAGYGQRDLVCLISYFAISIAILVSVLMLLINPWIAAKRDALSTSDQASLQLAQTVMPGRFQLSSDGRFVIYVSSLSRDRERADDVFLAEQLKTGTLIDHASDTAAWSVIRAKSGYFWRRDVLEDPYFVMENGYRYVGMPGLNDYQVMQFERYAIRIPEHQRSAVHLREESMSTWQLWQHGEKPIYAAEWQWRLSMGIVTLMLALLAVPLSAWNPRSGRYLVLLPAGIIYIVYINLLFWARRLIDQASLSPILGLWWVHGLMICLIAAVWWYDSKQRVSN